MNKEYIYIGQYVHTEGVNLQEVGVTEKKIGLTTNTPERRARGISSNKMTIQYTQIAAWEVEDCRNVETTLFRFLKNDRLEGEWFKDDNNDLVDRINELIVNFGLGKRYEFKNDGHDNIIYDPSPDPTDKWNKFLEIPIVAEFKDKLIANGYRFFPTKTFSYAKIAKGDQTGNSIVLLRNLELDSWIHNDNAETIALFSEFYIKKGKKSFTGSSIEKSCYRKSLEELGVDKAIHIVNEYYKLNY